MRLLTKTVPLSPRRSERAFGTPLMNTSILNPFGSLSWGTGNLSAAMGKGGGLMPRSLVAASEVGWLGVGGGGVGVDCWAAAGQAASTVASVTASTSARCGGMPDGHAILPDRAFTWRRVSDRSHPRAQSE